MTARARRLTGPLLLIPVVTGLAVACGPNGPSPSPTAPPSSTAVASADESSASVGSPSSVVGQTDSAWGRVWDSVPSTFPVAPGANLSDEAQSGPSSGVFVVPAGDAGSVAAWYADSLAAAGFHVDASSTPLEDGALVIDATGQPPGCALEVTVAPLGGVTSITVLYGATCPND